MTEPTNEIMERARAAYWSNCETLDGQIEAIARAIMEAEERGAANVWDAMLPAAIAFPPGALHLSYGGEYTTYVLRNDGSQAWPIMAQFHGSTCNEIAAAFVLFVEAIRARGQQ